MREELSMRARSEVGGGGEEGAGGDFRIGFVGESGGVR